MYLTTGDTTSAGSNYVTTGGAATGGISLLGAGALLLAYMVFKLLTDDRKGRRGVPTFLSIPLSFGKKKRKKRPLKRRAAKPKQLSPGQIRKQAWHAVAVSKGLSQYEGDKLFRDIEHARIGREAIRLKRAKIRGS